MRREGLPGLYSFHRKLSTVPRTYICRGVRSLTAVPLSLLKPVPGLVMNLCLFFSVAIQNMRHKGSTVITSSQLFARYRAYPYLPAPDVLLTTI